MRALLCESTFSSTHRAISASISSVSPTKLQNVPSDRLITEDIPNSLVNLTHFQELSLSNHWESYVDTDSMDIDAKLDDNHSGINRSEPSDTRFEKTRYSTFGGLGVVLGTLSSWNVTSMIEDPFLPERAARVKGRFFMELMRNSFPDSKFVETNVIQGRATSIETRVIVVQEVGITLAILFGLSFCLLVITFWFSRLPR
jgi:hypothetical protein